MNNIFAWGNVLTIFDGWIYLRKAVKGAHPVICEKLHLGSLLYWLPFMYIYFKQVEYSIVNLLTGIFKKTNKPLQKLFCLNLLGSHFPDVSASCLEISPGSWLRLIMGSHDALQIGTWFLLFPKEKKMSTKQFHTVYFHLNGSKIWHHHQEYKKTRNSPS